MQQSSKHLAVVSRDHVQADALGADRGALADLGAAAETFGVVLVDHGKRARVPLGLALWKQAQVGDLRAEEQRCRTVGAGRHAGSAADARRCLESSVGVRLRDGDCVRMTVDASADGKRYYVINASKGLIRIFGAKEQK